MYKLLHYQTIVYASICCTKSLNAEIIEMLKIYSRRNIYIYLSQLPELIL